MPSPRATLACTALLLASLASAAGAAERTQRFDADPGWEGRNNRATVPAPRTVRQDFGWSARTSHASKQPGEVGGFLSPAAEPAWYARPIPRRSLADPLSASGALLCQGRQFHVLVGFFNSRSTNEWRTANTVVLRLLGRGDVFYAYVEYCTGKWRAGGDHPGGFATVRDPATGRLAPRGFKTGAALPWSLRYDPAGNSGTGTVAVTLGGETAVCHLDPGHKADGAAFDRFGLVPVLKSADSGGEVWLGDVSINGQAEDFTSDPGWEGMNNRRQYTTADVRPRFDFGWSPTRHAGGAAAGELGGLVFRGDCRYPDRLAAYGDRLRPLSLEQPLLASGKAALRRAVTDSTVLLGFYHSQDSLTVNPSQSSGLPRSFLGLAVEGPSREGFLVYPAYRVRGDGQASAVGRQPPHLLPDGSAHDWSFAYDPAGAEGRGRITLMLDRASVTLDLAAADRATGATFDRFGLVTTWIDGNGQRIFFDDLTYTCGP